MTTTIGFCLLSGKTFGQLVCVCLVSLYQRCCASKDCIRTNRVTKSPLGKLARWAWDGCNLIGEETTENSHCYIYCCNYGSDPLSLWTLERWVSRFCLQGRKVSLVGFKPKG